MVEVEGRAPAFASMVVPSAPPDLYPALRKQVRSDTLEILPFRPMARNHDFTEMVKDDPRPAELDALHQPLRPPAQPLRTGRPDVPSAPSPPPGQGPTGPAAAPRDAP